MLAPRKRFSWFCLGVFFKLRYMLLVQKLIGETENSTVSILTCDNDFMGFIIEDGHREVKEWGETRIPAGTYTIEGRKVGKFYNKYSSRFGHKFVPHLQDVPNFTYILMHIGNYIKDTHGCLLLNWRFTFNENTGNYEGSSSTDCYKNLYSKINVAFLKGEEVKIQITR